MEGPIRFIVIDDDEINNLYCNIIIGEAAGELEIKTFNIPEIGFKYIAETYLDSKCPTVLFLDINMPTWSGWDFLHNFEKLENDIKQQIKIYILSSSVDPADHQRASDNKYVHGYFEKPLSESNVLSTLAASPL